MSSSPDHEVDLGTAGTLPAPGGGSPLAVSEPTRADGNAERLVVQERDRIRAAWFSGALTRSDPQAAFDPSVTAFLGIDMSKAFLVLAACPVGPVDQIRIAEVWGALRSPALRESGFLAAAVDDVIVVVVQRPEPADADSDQRHIERTVGALQPVLGRRMKTGIGRVARTGRDIPVSLAEARLAINSPHGGNSASIVHIADVNIFGLLSLITDGSALGKFVDDNIGPLRDEIDLLATLQVLLDCNFAVATAARRMHVHYNTMRYRLDRLAQILGPIESDPSRLLAIQLALYIRKMLA